MKNLILSILLISFISCSSSQRELNNYGKVVLSIATPAFAVAGKCSNFSEVREFIRSILLKIDPITQEKSMRSEICKQAVSLLTPIIKANTISDEQNELMGCEINLAEMTVEKIAEVGCKVIE